jgi:two-component system cell cycle sensor histidine kinase/response regulator CckA
LKESNLITELNFQKLFESSPGLYLLLNKNFIIKAVTNSFLEATLTKREEILDRYIFDVFPDNPDDPDATGVRNLSFSLNSVVKNKATHIMEIQKYDVKRPESEGGGFAEKYWKPVNYPFFNEKNKLTHIIHHVEDVTETELLIKLNHQSLKISVELEKELKRRTHQSFTERTEIENELFLNREEYHTLVKNFPHGSVIIFDKDLKYTIADGEALKNIGLSSEILVGKTIWDFEPPETYEKLVPAFKSVLQGENFQFEQQYHGHYYNMNIFPVKNKEGEIYAGMIITEDITDIKKTELALRESLELNIAALNSISSNVVILDKEGIIITVNDAWNNFAVTNGAILEKVGLGINYLDICRKAIGEQADLAKEVMDGIQKVIEGKINNFTQEYIVDASYEKKWFLLQVLPLARANGGVLIKHTNITQSKLLEEKLLKSQKLDAIGRLAAGIAHDFNNLLTVIQGSVQLASMKTKSGKDILHDLEQISEASERAANLTNQLLVFASKQVISAQIIELNSLIINLNKMLNRLINKSIDFNAALTPEACLIKADPGQIEQVIVNLIVNACHAMPNGGKLFIETTNTIIQKNMGESEEFVLLKIRDTGTGMTEQVKSHIFEPFFTTKEIGKGTGLGMATCYGIVNQFGGNIEIESILGVGTTIKIYLPRETGEADIISFSHDNEDVPDGTETILLVDDEPLVLNITANILKSHGYKVLEARNGDDAIEVFNHHPNENIQLIVTDVSMPFMTGSELVQVIRSENPDINVIFMSGYTEDPSVYNELDDNIQFIHKPFLPVTLLKNVRRLLDKNVKLNS